MRRREERRSEVEGFDSNCPLHVKSYSKLLSIVFDSQPNHHICVYLYCKFSKCRKSESIVSNLPVPTVIIFFFRFMQIAERSSTYGSRFYRVIDQSNCPCVLALNSKGIVQFDRNDISAPLRVRIPSILFSFFTRASN